MNEVMLNLSNHFGSPTKFEELKKIEDLEKVAKEYKRKLLEKDQSLSLKTNQLTYLQKNIETLKSENTYLYEEIDKKKNIYEENLAKDVEIKHLEEKFSKLHNKLLNYAGEISNYKETVKDLESKLKNKNEGSEEAEFKYAELKIKFDGLSQSEDFFKQEVLRKEQELDEKLKKIKSLEVYNTQLQSKIHHLSLEKVYFIIPNDFKIIYLKGKFHRPK